LSSSVKPTTLASVVSLMTSSVLLTRSGSTLRVACGRMTQTIVRQRESPVERAASAWPAGTLSSPARKISP
jgi:hypothetical protein